MENKYRRYINPLLRIIGVVLFIIILMRVDLRSVFRQYSGANAAHLALATLLIVALIAIKSLRWKLIASMQGIEIPLKKSILAYTASLYLGIVTPGRIGDFAKSYYLVNAGVSTGKALFSSLLDRLFDIIILVAVGYISLLYFPDIISNQLIASTLVLALIIIVIAALLARRELIVRIIRRSISSVKLIKKGERISDIIEEMLKEFDLLGTKNLLLLIALTIAAWSFHYSFFIISAHTLGILIPKGTLIMSISAAIFIGLIPISIAGVGTRDIALILIFNHIGLSRAQAISFSLSFVFMYIIVGLIGFICWMLSPFSFDGDESDQGK